MFIFDWIGNAALYGILAFALFGLSAIGYQILYFLLSLIGVNLTTIVKRFFWPVFSPFILWLKTQDNIKIEKLITSWCPRFIFGKGSKFVRLSDEQYFFYKWNEDGIEIIHSKNVKVSHLKEGIEYEYKPWSERTDDAKIKFEAEKAEKKK